MLIMERKNDRNLSQSRFNKYVKHTNTCDINTFTHTHLFYAT